MEIINLLGASMGLAFVSGINTYATILAVGLGVRMDLIQLSPEMAALEVLGHPLIIVIAGTMYAAEFFADKVPWVDSAWDSVHTFIRPVAGAWMASTAIGAVDPVAEFAVYLLGGGVALSTHATKATTRLLVNQSPEPFTNSIVSVAEDVVAVGGTWLAIQHPAVMLVIVVVSLAIIAYLGPKILRMLRAELLAFGAILGGLFRGRVAGTPRWDAVPLRYRGALEGVPPPKDVDFCLRAICGTGTGLRRNLIGYLYGKDNRVVFATRSYFRPKRWDLSLADAEDAWLEKKLLWYRLHLEADGIPVQFYFFRDRTGRAERVMTVLEGSVRRRVPEAGTGKRASAAPA